MVDGWSDIGVRGRGKEIGVEYVEAAGNLCQLVTLRNHCNAGEAFTLFTDPIHPHLHTYNPLRSYLLATQ